MSDTGIATDPVIGSGTLTFDPTHAYTDGSTSGLVVNNFNLPLDGGMVFYYDPSFGLILGGEVWGAEVVYGFNNDFAIQIVSPLQSDFGNL